MSIRSLLFTLTVLLQSASLCEGARPAADKGSMMSRNVDKDGETEASWLLSANASPLLSAKADSIAWPALTPGPAEMELEEEARSEPASETVKSCDTALCRAMGALKRVGRALGNGVATLFGRNTKEQALLEPATDVRSLDELPELEKLPDWPVDILPGRVDICSSDSTRESAPELASLCDSKEFYQFLSGDRAGYTGYVVRNRESERPAGFLSRLLGRPSKTVHDMAHPAVLVLQKKDIGNTTTSGSLPGSQLEYRLTSMQYEKLRELGVLRVTEKTGLLTRVASHLGCRKRGQTPNELELEEEYPSLYPESPKVPVYVPWTSA